jgi:AcrR family transcriptional regulator
MPRAFSEREKEIVKNNLLKAGRDLFGSLGLRKTTVQDLAKTAGIAKGSFYLFYESKEELFLEILDQVEQEIHSTMLKKLSIKQKDRRKLFRTVILEQFYQVESNPFLRMILVKEEFDYLWRKIPKEKLKDGIDLDKNFIRLFFKELPIDIRLKEDDIEVLSMAFRGLFLLILHKKELGTGSFPKVITLLTDLLINHIFSLKE